MGRLSAQPLSALMTIAVIAIALALPAGLQLMVANGRALSGQWDGAIEIAVYLKQDITPAAAGELADSLRDDPGLGSVRVIPADEALEEFRESSGFGAALDALTENPLPNLLLLTPADGHDSAEAVAALSDRLRKELPADIVQADTEWVARFHAMLDVVRRVVALAGAMLALGVVLIVGNTIRLDIQNRRDEIEVAKLIGATDGFIRRPFLYSGFWYGLFGGSARARFDHDLPARAGGAGTPGRRALRQRLPPDRPGSGRRRSDRGRRRGPGMARFLALGDPEHAPDRARKLKLSFCFYYTFSCQERWNSGAR